MLFNEQVGPLLPRDVAHGERLVVAPPLKHLSEEALGAPRPALAGRREDDQHRPLEGLSQQ